MALTAFALSIVALPIYAQTQGPAESTNQPPVVPTEMVIELEHKVKKGETLYAIGKHYHCSVAELQALNPGIGMLKPGMKVKVKQRTKVPAQRHHPVARSRAHQAFVHQGLERHGQGQRGPSGQHHEGQGQRDAAPIRFQKGREARERFGGAALGAVRVGSHGGQCRGRAASVTDAGAFA